MEEELRFASFSIVPARRSLKRDGANVALGSRAIDILLFLISTPGALKTNDEIVKHVWPDTYVDEANLRVHLSALRKALGDTKSEPQFIANIPGRGYTFVGEVIRDRKNTQREPIRPPTPDDGGQKVFGRNQIIEGILEQLPKSRLFTITGPGGIGKSTVAKAVVSQLAGELEIIKVELSDIASGDLVPAAVASSLGIKYRSDNVLATICATLETRPVTIFLDGCEHLIDDVTDFVEAVLQRTSNTRFLATSREPLRASGERVHRLLPLDVPVSTVKLEEALDSPAVQLFVQRADACLGGYQLTEMDVPIVIDICARLDGIALAIELAAGRLESMSILSLAASLHDCFRVLSRGRRTALPRHQTLRATLDWSYQLLAVDEQRGLNELSIFRGRFSISAAAAVLSDDTYDLVAALVAKSLVVAETSASTQLYRLLDTTRIYAAEKLAQTHGVSPAMEKFGTYLLQLFDTSSARIYSQTTEEAVEEFGHIVLGLRACLDWALSTGGNKLLGARLTVAALPLFFKLSLYDECISAVTASIDYLNANPGIDEASRMKLYTAMGWPQIITAASPGRGVEAWNESADIAERLGDVDHQLRAIWGLWVDAINRAEPKTGLHLATRFAKLAISSPDPADIVIGNRIRGATLHWLGRHAESETYLETMLRDYQGLPSTGHVIRFQFDQRVTAQIILSRCKWFLGRQQEAMADVVSTLEYAQSVGHYASLTNALAEAACPLALMSGQDRLAAEYIALLKEHTKATMLDVWRTYAVCFEAELLRRQGDDRTALSQIQSGLQSLRNAGFNLFETMFITTEARALSGLGRNVEAINVINTAMEKCAAAGVAWWQPEMLRTKAEIQLKTSDLGEARSTLALAYEFAQSAGAIPLLKSVEDSVFACGLYEKQLSTRQNAS